MGLLLTFIGSKFIIVTISILIFLGIVILCLIMAINFHIVTLDGSDDGMAYLVGTLIFGVIIGILVSILVARIARKYAVPVLAAWAGVTITTMIVSPLKIQNGFKLAIIGLSVIVSIILGFKYNRKIKALATAIIGSGLLMFGIGSYAGGFPSVFKLTKKDIPQFDKLEDVNYGYLGYFFGFIFMSIIGLIFQLKYIDQIDLDEDDMMKWEDK